MSRSQGQSSLKRKQPGSSPSLTDPERIVHELIRSKQSSGIWMRDLKEQANLPEKMVEKSLLSLKNKNLIKPVVNIHNKSKKHFIACEFEPSPEITGGAWYVDGSLDTEFIGVLRAQCYGRIQKMKVATVEQVCRAINGMGILNVAITMEQISEIVRALVLDNEVMEVSSNGSGEFESIPAGRLCYRCTSRGGFGKGVKVGAMASIPCGVCPHIRLCTPDGAINPRDCVYFNKFLEF